MKIDKNKTYTVTQIADIAGVSKASVSRWLSAHHVSPKHTKGKSKYFDATYVEQYLNAHKANNSKDSDTLTPTSLLQEQVNMLTRENERLTKENQAQSELIKQKDKEIADYAQRFATLADQAQHLHLADQKHIIDADKSIERIASAIEATSPPPKDAEEPSQQPPETQKSPKWWEFWKK